ncbi:MAG: hypothetical protein A2Z21_05020 [Candidatus Fraserbacteria bacterium RBG_16_55_9]|uniref:Uncharacterized protein n=1 Tax=Fraserbacteria sp. (strain RBG_16_55_9) TaxID=1817864 RepID=A0A1F5V0Y7_FRAXR|nr:MAG: hypothetical protein A2Z21_05020 [Candidatus Fraserbacteria bacterium RBG_16_55_9]
MKHVRLAVSGVGLLALVWIAWQVLFPGLVGGGASANLQELRAVNIVVEALSPDAEREQITRGLLEDQVLVALRSKTPNLRFDSGVLPYLYINLTLMSSDLGYTGNLYVELHRPVEILVGVHRFGQKPSRRLPAVVSVWDSGVTIRGPKGEAADHVRRGLDRMMEQFLADYFRANP